jgi:hypothetical protein
MMNIKKDIERNNAQTKNWTDSNGGRLRQSGKFSTKASARVESMTTDACNISSPDNFSYSIFIFIKL